MNTLATPPSIVGFCLAAPHSNSGKTTLSLALIRAFQRRGYTVQSFKCGPDYIDPSYHRQLTQRPCPNLDTWLMEYEGVQNIWQKHMRDADIGVCEGVMGLFDGRSPHSLEGSTADCALALHLPVLLVVSAQGMAGSIAALVEGFLHYHPHLFIAGIIANKVGSPNHTHILREALSSRKLPPLLGGIPNDPTWILPSRQLGLIPAEELEEAMPIEAWADTLEKYLDLDTLIDILLKKTIPYCTPTPTQQTILPPVKRLAIAKDAAFCFYYEENLDYLREKGWELIEFSPLHDTNLPPCIDALYLGGGYPEQFAEELSLNTAMHQALKEHAKANKEIFAECGGYMYLCKKLILPTGKTYPMAGILDASAFMGTRLRSLGYREVTLDSMPLNLAPTPLRGHEFHWSSIVHHKEYAPLYSFRNKQGEIQQDGISHNNIRAGYIHLYWAHPSLDNTEPRHPALPKIIILNGASSAGKTSLAKAFQEISPIPFFLLSADMFIASAGIPKHSLIHTWENDSLPLIKTFHTAIGAVAQTGTHLIIDHVVGEKSEWIQDLISRLPLDSYFFVKVHCTKDTLIERETQRKDRPADTQHALRQAETIHRHISYSIEIDTTNLTPRQAAEKLLAKLP